jgi:hypothetical protein
VKRPSSLPDPNRVGVLTAAILLAFALTRLVPSPQYDLRMNLGEFLIEIPLNLATGLALLAAGLTATGMDWLLRAHPALGGKSTAEHWLLPTLTTFILAVPLAVLPPGPVWWAAFTVGGIILIAVFFAEYVAVDPSAPAYAAATAGLTAVSFAIHLILITALRFAGVRMILLVPSVFIVAALIGLRTLHLRLGGRWEFGWAVAVGLVSTQLAAGLHYWPLSPLQFGLILLGELYALISLAIQRGEGIPLRRAAAEPLAGFLLAITAAVLLR